MGALTSRLRALLHRAPLFSALVVSACAHVPPSRYGVKSFTLEGMKKLDDHALAVCLATAERERAGFSLGIRPPPECNHPPFDQRVKQVRLWPKQLEDWPLFDRGAFADDHDRILGWYAARGFHEARITAESVDPPRAAQRDTIDPAAPDPGCTRLDDDEGCIVNLRVAIDEGPETLITATEVRGLDALPASLRRALSDTPALRPGRRFDETIYEQEKQRILNELHERGYAVAKIAGQVRVDVAAHTAHVVLLVEPGPICRFGEVTVDGAPPYLEGGIRAMTAISRGDRFNLRAIQTAQRAVFASGGFLSVSVQPLLPERGDTVDVKVTVVPARKHRAGVGVGIQAGIVTRGDTWDPVSVPQWDVHLVAKYTQQRVANGLRTLVLEDRPAMIVQSPFPSVTTPRFGNELRAQLRQAQAFDPRAVLQLAGAYVWGPDPYDTFFRHRVDSGIGIERPFLPQDRLFVTLGLKNSVYRVPGGEITMEGTEPPADSLLTYFYGRIRFDYRDNPARPHYGLMVQTEVQVGGIEPISSWRYLRSTPDLRFYVPLPLHATLAFRFALGIYAVFEADSRLDDLSRRLGPRDYRLRGGGATSNRGWLPGELGDGPDGGARRWETSGELRFPVTPNLSVCGFFDAGDVSKETKFRWNYPQASSGFGLRYHTLIGPLRLDFAWRIKNMQVYGPDERDPGGEQSTIDFGFAKMSGAIHLTIGESF